MAALPADIGAGLREASLSSWENASIKARYPSARDALSPPAEGFFDSAADAQVAVDQRAALLGVERRRFAVPTTGAIWIDPTTGLPSYRLVDAGQSVDMACLPARLEVNLEAETTTLELFG